jgi:hypothetical protein
LERRRAMSQFSLNTALITSVFTILGGIIVFIFSQIALKFILEPLAEYRKVKSQIAFNLIYYANIYMNPVESNNENLENESLRNKLNETSEIIRKLSCEFTGSLQIIPLYQFFSLMGLIPSKSNAQLVKSNLIGISNSLYYPTGGDDLIRIDSNLKRRSEISRILKLHNIE